MDDVASFLGLEPTDEPLDAADESVGAAVTDAADASTDLAPPRPDDPEQAPVVPITPIVTRAVTILDTTGPRTEARTRPRHAAEPPDLPRRTGSMGTRCVLSTTTSTIPKPRDRT